MITKILTILGQCFSLLSQPQTYLLNIMLEKAIPKRKTHKQFNETPWHWSRGSVLSPLGGLKENLDTQHQTKIYMLPLESPTQNQKFQGRWVRWKVEGWWKEGLVRQVGVAAVWRGYTPFKNVEHSTTERAD